MSRTFDIPRSLWPVFLNEVSKREDHHLVRVEIVGEDLGDQELNEPSLPLLGVSMDEKGEQADTVDIVIGREGEGGTVDHRVTKAQRLFAEEDDDGSVKNIDIDDGENHHTIIYFD